MPGTYDGGIYLEDLRGTRELPIWIGGIPGEDRPVIHGGSQAVHLVRARYLVLENVEIAHTTQNGINCDDGADYANPDATRHLVFRNLDFHDIGRGGNQDALKLSGVDDYFVLDCQFARTSAGGSGIDQVGCHQGLIARCKFTDIGSNAIQCKGGSRDIEIRWNRFVNGGQRAINIGGSTGFQYFRPPLSTTAPNAEARDIRVIANLFCGSDAPVAFVGAEESLVANNTFIRPRHWLLRILQETTSRDGYRFVPCGHNRFLNNIVQFDSSQIRTAVNIGPNTDPDSFRFSHNLWYAVDRPSRSRPTLPTPETKALVGQAPQFLDDARGGYALSPHSPAAASGLPCPGVRADIEERCYAPTPSRGAWEARPGAISR